LTQAPLALPSDSDVPELARVIEQAGGRVIVVGGYVRDALCGRASHDLDLEVFGLPEERVEAAIAGFGFSPRVGRQLPIWRRVRDGLDLAYPRAGALDYRPGRPGTLEAAFRAAARHRDLTVNAIGWDPISGALVDPWGGVADLSAKRLRAVDRETFASDPVRLLRVARLQALLGAEVDSELEMLCRRLDLAGLPVERVAGELRRLLVDGARPSRGLAWLAAIDRLDVFPPIAALVGVPQDPIWHPEGDVFVHTLLVLDRASEIAAPLGATEREILMLAALGHDFGKPETTTDEAGRIRAIAHEAAGARIARAWLAGLRFPERIVNAVAVLIEYHLAPVQLVSGRAGPRSYRRLARKLAAGGMSLVDLERLARADQLGRTTEAALSGSFEAGDVFLEAALAARVLEAPRSDVVRARDLIERGVIPGPELGRLLRRCRELEDESGERDPERILDRCLAEERGPSPD
jgi:tRNA nucleotidyltransferase (CCA-adding enzyme)